MGREKTKPRLDKLSEASRLVFTHFPVRKTKAQKEAFRAEAARLLRDMGWPVRTQAGGGLIKSNNLIAGDVEKARLVLTAHYDTPANMLLPNFIAPRNLAVTLLFQLALAALLCVPCFLAPFAARLLGAPFLPALVLGLAALYAELALIMAGPANPANANDNTSGVLTLLEAAGALPPEARETVALVFFDNEEKGLMGASRFAREYGRLPHTLLLNFDCVGVGEELLFVLPGSLRRGRGAAQKLRAAFAPPPGGRGVLVDRSPFTLYPSDQLLFRRGVGVAALRRLPVVGRYMSRIHTPRDRLLEQDNILLLKEGVLRLAAALPDAELCG